MKKNIGIVTWLGSGNYGTNLQAFALYKFISNHGYGCKFKISQVSNSQEIKRK